MTLGTVIGAIVGLLSAGLAIAVAGHADVLPDVAPHADLVLGSAAETATFLRGVARRAVRPGP